MAQPLAVITGASSGIGATFARKLAPTHDLLLVARRADRLDELASGLVATHGINVDIFPADLTKTDDVRRLASRLASSENLDLLVNNAGFGSRGRFWESSVETQQQMHELHVMATMRLTHAALGNMVPRNRGSVVNVASVAGFIRRPGSVSYSATKSWINIFTEGLYVELRGIGSCVKVQTLCPGFTYSEFHDVLKVSREGIASKKFWMTSDFVVDASLAGLRRGKLYVVPGWRYRALTAIVSKLPSRLRILVELRSGDSRVEKGDVGQ